MTKIGQVVLRHNCRAGNAAAHQMAREGSKQSTINKLLCCDVSPLFVESMMLEDKKNVVVVRTMLFYVCKSLAGLGNVDAIQGIRRSSNATCNSTILP